MTKTSFPFLPDAATRHNPVLESIAQMHDAHHAEVVKYRKEFTAEASAMFERSESDRRAKWIADYTSRNYAEPKFLNGRAMSQEDQYRISRPYETRIQDLVDARMFAQATRCYIVRSGATTVDQLKTGLAEYFPTTGTASIVETIPACGRNRKSPMPRDYPQNSLGRYSIRYDSGRSRGAFQMTGTSPSSDMADHTIVFTTSSDTALATATARNVCYTNCKELLAGGGRISHWRANGTGSGTVEIDPPVGTVAYEVHLKPGAAIQTHRTPEGVFHVMFRPGDVIKVVSLDEEATARELDVLYQHPAHDMEPTRS